MYYTQHTQACGLTGEGSGDTEGGGDCLLDTKLLSEQAVPDLLTMTLEKGEGLRAAVSASGISRRLPLRLRGGCMFCRAARLPAGDRRTISVVTQVLKMACCHRYCRLWCSQHTAPRASTLHARRAHMATTYRACFPRVARARVCSRCSRSPLPPPAPRRTTRRHSASS